jgi:alkaline phosphatase D
MESVVLCRSDTRSRLMRCPLAILTALAGSAAAQVPLAPPWCGATGPTSVVVTLPLDQAGVSVRLAVSTAADLHDPRFSAPVQSVPEAGNAVRLEMDGLVPDTLYFYAVELDGTLLAAQGGRFRTFPAAGPASFRFAFSSCGEWDRPQHAYDAVRLEDPLFFIHMGDLHYEDTDEDDPGPYRENYLKVLNESPEQGDLFRQVPTFYIWDDHDFSGNTSDRTSDGRQAARQVYRERVPHFPLPAGGPDASIHQAFSCGRVRFILSDLRSERDPDGEEDDAGKSMMGAAQKQWFKQQLLAARAAECPLIVWMSGLPLLSNSSARDNWGSYQTERRELLEFIRDERIQNVVVISGDMHALAYDDGSGTEEYVPGVRIPVFHAGALARPGSEKGGPYSGGVSEGAGRYGILEIDDQGGVVSATYRGRIATSATAVTTWKSHTHVTEPVRPRPARDLQLQPATAGTRLEWTDDSAVEDGFRIERRGNGGPWETLATTAANETTCLDDTANPELAYDYRVVAVNGTVEADPSPPAGSAGLVAYRAWKLAGGSGVAAADDGDEDHDGIPLVAEYLFGLNPHQADRFPWTASRGENGVVTVAHPTLPGRLYRIEISADLDRWEAMPAVPGDGLPREWTDGGTIIDAPEKRFYRIVVSFLP